MKKLALLILLTSLSMLLYSQEKKEPGYTKQFIKEAVPGSYEEMSLPKEKLLTLKQFEPITQKKVKALINLNILSKTQGKLINAKIDKEGLIKLPEFDKQIKAASIPLALILKLINHHEGPYTKDILLNLHDLEILTSTETAQLEKFLNPKGTIPGIPQEEMIISVLDNWKGVPLNSFGMIDSDQLLIKWEKDKDLKKLYQLIEDHQEIMTDLSTATDPRSYKIKDIKKLHKKRNKKIESYLKKALALEVKIAQIKSLMSYLYLAGVYQIRYSSDLITIQNLDRDAGNLFLCLLKKTDKKNKSPKVISAENYHLTGLERFICIDKSLLWLVNKTRPTHKELAKRILKDLLNNSRHPPWEAPYLMWRDWWKGQQKLVYTAIVKPEEKINDK